MNRAIRYQGMADGQWYGCTKEKRGAARSGTRVEKLIVVDVIEEMTSGNTNVDECKRLGTLG
jgi:hypothetical protein